ncbi:MAG: hypothetical protein ACOZQL_35675 [Myxococcota bacterium]
MIGTPLHTGQCSEVIPVAPRADVRAPLVMERLLASTRGPDMLAEASRIGRLMTALGPPWQHVIAADFDGVEAQFISERFVGVTVRELSAALRNSGRVLPLDVLRAISEQLLRGLAPLASLPAHPRSFLLTDRSVGLALDGTWRFAHDALNHWLADVVPPALADDPEYDGMIPTDTLLFLSPEAVAGRAETPASLATRAALLLFQLATGGFHPYRGDRFSQFQSLTRYINSALRIEPGVHPDVPRELAAVLVRGVRFDGARFGSLEELAAALEATWPEPAASPRRTFDVVAGLTWKTIEHQLDSLRREPLLPLRWDGVWPLARTPEAGLAVLEDQLLEQLQPPELLPLRGELPVEGRTATPAPARAVASPSSPELAPEPARRPGFIARLLAFFNR